MRECNTMWALTSKSHFRCSRNDDCKVRSVRRVGRLDRCARGVLCCVVMCGVGAGVGAQCVCVCVCGGGCVVRGACCVCWVCNAAWHAEKLPVCRFKTSPCVRSKRLRVYWQNARMCSTHARFAGTHGSVLNLHTETF